MMDEVRRMQQLAEIKINNPIRINKISLDTFKKVLIEHELQTAIHLNFENVEDYIKQFSQKINNIKEFDELPEIYEEFGYDGSTQPFNVIQSLFII